MTTEVKIEHNGGNHAVIIEINGVRQEGKELRTKGEVFTAYVYQGQSITAREATDAEETELRGPSGYPRKP